jgi:hypothetical protein
MRVARSFSLSPFLKRSPFSASSSSLSGCVSASHLWHSFADARRLTRGKTLTLKKMDSSTPSKKKYAFIDD